MVHGADGGSLCSQSMCEKLYLPARCGRPCRPAAALPAGPLRTQCHDTAIEPHQVDCLALFLLLTEPGMHRAWHGPARQQCAAAAAAA